MSSPLNFVPQPGESTTVAGGVIFCQQVDLIILPGTGQVEGEVTFKFYLSQEAYEGMRRPMALPVCVPTLEIHEQHQGERNQQDLNNPFL